MEKVPHGQGTHDILTTLKIHSDDVGALMETYRYPDEDSRREDLGMALTFRDMSEVASVESRLRDVVDIWLAKENMAVDVEYSLRSEAKGKGRA